MTTNNEHGQQLAAARLLTIVGLAGIGLIHLLDSVETFHETRWLFWAYVALMASTVIVGGALVHRPSVGWSGAAALLALVPIIGYVLSRTSGLPGSDDDIGNWTDPLGLASLFVEGCVVAVGAYGFTVLARSAETARYGARTAPAPVPVAPR
jgi:hypothetical protein